MDDPTPLLPALTDSGGPAPHSLLDFDPVPLRARADGWTPDRQRAFIEALADTGCVSLSAAKVGMSEKSAHNLRKRPGAGSFNRAWEQAARLGKQRLEGIAWQRAVEGVEIPYYFRGELVGTRRIYSDKLLLFLLGRSDSEPAGQGALTEEQDAAEVDRLCRNRIIEEHSGRIWTSFPPPDDFDGEEQADYGDRDYWRSLTEAEMAAYERRKLRPRAAECELRDRYFGFPGGGGDER